MLKNQQGSVLFWVLSAVLAIALIAILALSGMFNLDPEKNTDDCTTNMKNIWVAANDYVLETQQDFNGDLNMLRTTTKPGSKQPYLTEEKYCPELQGEKTEYQVFGKYLYEVIDGETKHYSGILVFCPNIADFPAHVLDKAFYDSMSTSKIQNVMISDLALIDSAKKSAKQRSEEIQKYLNYWKNTPHKEFNAANSDPALVQWRQSLAPAAPSQSNVFPEDNFMEEATPAETETE